jgi:hypothetical protein
MHMDSSNSIAYLYIVWIDVIAIIQFLMDISTDLYNRWPALQLLQLLEKTILYKEWVGSFSDAWVAIFNALLTSLVNTV